MSQRSYYPNAQTRTVRFFEWANRHVRPIVGVTVLVALVLGGIFAVVADTSEPQFDPEGEIYTLLDRADSTLVSESTIGNAMFLVEAAEGGDVLTAAAFQEWQAASERVRANHDDHLVDRFDPDLGATVPGVVSVVDLVEDNLPNGLTGATDADVKAALAEIFSDDSALADFRFTLSEQATATTSPDGNIVWTSPAFTASVVYDEAGFEDEVATEVWLRSVQADFREGASVTDSIGLAIDFETTVEEAAMASAPFIFIAVSLVVMLIAVVHRSFWSAALVASGLGVTMLTYNGVAALAGLKMGSLMLSFIVPIALISFGVDFYIHGSGRVREMQVEGLDRRSAYPAGMTAVFTGMLLAVTTSVAAFLANALSGTEAIVEFGIAAAIGLIVAYVVLGLIAPRVLLAIEQTVGPNKVAGKARWAYRAIMLPTAIVAGLAVTLAALQPAFGTAAVATMLIIVVAIPVVLTRRRNRKAVESGHPTDETIRGAAHGLNVVGKVVHGPAKWRMITIPVAIGLGALGLVAALQVDSGFEISDLLSSRTDFVQSMDRANEHFPSSGAGSAMVYIEGDLTQPANLVAIDAAVERIDASGAEFGRNADGELLAGVTAVDAVRMVMATPTMVTAVGESTGISMTDDDGNGLPDTAAQVQAVYDHIAVNGIVSGDGTILMASEDVPQVVASLDGGGGQATAIVVQIGSFTGADIIQPAWDVLQGAADELGANTTGLTTVGTTGEVITQSNSLEAFSRSMLISLPIAIALALLIAGLILRSVRYAFAAVIPIAFVVTGVYAFMYLAGYKINLVTAVIAAIAVGIGIDFSTHFTARFREELATDGQKLEALRRAGVGTGGALVLSATTSVLGFAVMAFAPMPLFATFGVLTAVMIALALAASLLVLPSVLALLTPRPRTEPDPIVPQDDIKPERKLVPVS